MNMRRRGSATASDGDDNARRRQPFRPLQPLRTPNPTPPREVFLTPRATPKPLKRRPSSRPKRTATKVKTEPPDVDPSKARPSSPSDDPLLLSGPLRARFTPAFSSSPPLPPVSFAARLSGGRARALPSSSSPDAGVHALPTFAAPRTVMETSGAWSDSDDDDGFNLTGEYTGHYKILRVPTKADPPTRERMSWGRPVSPFPYSAIMERSLPLEDVAEDACVLDSVVPCEHVDVDVWEVATEPPPSDIEPSSSPSVSEDEFGDLDDDFLAFELDAESTMVRPLVAPREDLAESDHSVLEEQEEEAQIDRELSVPVDDGLDVAHSKAVDYMQEDSSEEEDDVEGEDIIKITSEDPKAAARAAAILRMVGEYSRCTQGRADQSSLARL